MQTMIEVWSIDPSIYGQSVKLCRPAVAPGAELSPGGYSNFVRARKQFDDMTYRVGSPRVKTPKRAERTFRYANETNHRQKGKEPWMAVEWLMDHQGARESDIPLEFRRHLVWDAKMGRGVIIE